MENDKGLAEEIDICIERKIETLSPIHVTSGSCADENLSHIKTVELTMDIPSTYLSNIDIQKLENQLLVGEIGDSTIISVTIIHIVPGNQEKIVLEIKYIQNEIKH